MLVPLFDRVLLKRSQAPDVTPGGILIPQTVQKSSFKCEVVAIGPGRVLNDGSRLEMAVKVGDTVLLTENDGVMIDHLGEPMVFIREFEIMAIVAPD